MALSSAGIRGRPDVWVARSTKVLLRPPRSGMVTLSGRCLATGSSSLTSPRRAISLSNSDVNTLVFEPISKSVSLST